MVSVAPKGGIRYKPMWLFSRTARKPTSIDPQVLRDIQAGPGSPVANNSEADTSHRPSVLCHARSIPDTKPEDETGVAGCPSGLACVEGRVTILSVVSPTNIRADFAFHFIAEPDAGINI